MFKDAPKPSEIRSLNLDENQCVALIEVDIEQLIKKNSSKTVNKTVTLSSWLNKAGIKKELGI